VAAVHWLRENAPEITIRFVNVVDLMTLFTPDAHPHGMSQERFVELFTGSRPVVFAFHGYQRAVHELVHGRPNAERFHVRGFTEQGTTTTPFDMVVMNGMSRYDLAAEAIRRSDRLSDARKADLRERCASLIAEAVAYSRANFQDPPEIRDWVWTNQHLNVR
jgi:xylulose-5-phosphate/fructose-6-phosphate phosphoketolase